MTVTPAAASGELARAARGAAVTFVGALVSAFLGFGLNFLVARLLGPAGSGVVLQAMGVFTIAMSLALLGTDTAAIWLLPRLRATDPRRVRSAFVGVTLSALLGGAVVALAWFVLLAWWPGLLQGNRDLVRAITAVALFLPAGALMTVTIATTRAFGGVLPFNLIDRALVPGLRPVLTVLVVAAGGGTTAVALAWAAPWAVGMVAALAVALRQVRRVTERVGGPRRPDRRLLGTIGRYALPRAVAAVLDQAVIWLDVILVGIIAGPVAAGVYGATSRFVSAGVVVSNALRIVVAPRFSALLAERRGGDLQELYTVTAAWILLFGSPIYLTLAVFASTVLGWLGPGFVPGATSLVVLALGSLVVLAAGNVQSLLLMSGRSGLGALNKAVVVAFNVVGNLVLVPRIGIEGAALTWAASMVLDTVLAATQVRRHTGIALSVRVTARITAAVAGCVAVPELLVRSLLGDGWVSLLVAVAVAGAVLAGYVWLDRGALRVHELVPDRRRSSA